MAYIYVITNNINNKQYVGKTNYSIEKRFEEHKRDSRRRRCEKRPLYAAMNKYGIQNFSIALLEECSVDIVADREIYWIDKLNTLHNGYNATYGGDGKTLYNYKEVSDKYKELKSVKDTCAFFGCDWQVVKNACTEYNIPIMSGQEHHKKELSKPVWQIDKKTNQKLQKYDSLRAAGEALGDIEYRKHIGEVANGKRKTAYGYKWEFA